MCTPVRALFWFGGRFPVYQHLQHLLERRRTAIDARQYSPIKNSTDNRSRPHDLLRARVQPIPGGPV